MARVLVLDLSPASRLAVLAALGPGHEVHASLPDEEPLRQVRRVAPDVVLVGLAPDRGAAQRLVRAIQTDAGPRRRIAVVEATPHAMGPDAVLAWGVDGWLGDPSRAAALIDAVVTGPWPVRVGAFSPPAGLLRRLRRALL